MLLSPARPARFARLAAGLVGAGCLAALALSAALAYGAISDRRLDAARLRAVADDLAAASGFRVEVDEAIVDAANRVVSDSEARARFREGLARLASYRAVALPALERRGIPPVLLAMPQVESRVQALPPATGPLKAAGIWQFIPSTARRYGLRVDATADERLDARREVEAAAAHLADLRARLGDWSLAIAAWGEGEKRVAAGVARTGARDAAGLLAAGAIGRYTSAVLAAMLLVHEPALVD
jgi:hypothetical protein